MSAQPDLDPIGVPPNLLTLEGLNHVVAAILIIGTKRLGHEFGREVLTTAERLSAERQVAVAYHEE